MKLTIEEVQRISEEKFVVRRVCAKRARKLRKLGESVYWSSGAQSLVWHMPVRLYHYQRHMLRQLKNRPRCFVIDYIGLGTY